MPPHILEPEPHRTDVTVLGYHGTTLSKATDILANGWIPSSNPWDWLGDGIYAWENDPKRAWDWAQQITRDSPDDEAAIIELTVNLSGCLDLTQIAYRAALQSFAERYLRSLPFTSQLPSLKQRAKRHDLDCLIVNQYCAFSERQGVSYSVVRAAFPEGEPLYSVNLGEETLESAFHSLDHIQLAIRTMNVVSHLEVFTD